MVSDEEMRAYYEKQKEYDRRTQSEHPVSATFEEFMKKSRGGRGVRKAERREPSREVPRSEQPRAAPQPSLGRQVLGAGKNWLENASANLQGRQAPHRAKSGAGRWLANAGANVQHMNANPFGGMNPFGNPAAGLGMGLNVALPPGMGPEPRREPAPRKKKGKKHRRREPEQEESRPWDMKHLPPGVRRFI